MTRSIYGAIFIGVLAAACGGSNGDSHACGDGIVNGSEQCDDGNVISGDGCSSSCQKETANTCGDGTLDVATEGCDDGNNVDGDGCDSHCRVEHVAAICGNGTIETGETCDDNNHASADGCSATCQVETGYTCTGTPSVCTTGSSGAGTCAMPIVIAMAGTPLTGTGTGDTTSSTDQVDADCDGFTDDGNDEVLSFTLAAATPVIIQLNANFDASLRLTTVACDVSTNVTDAGEIEGCTDEGIEDEVLTYTNLAAGTYYIVVDSYDQSEAGGYSVTVTAGTLCGNGHLDGNEECDDGNNTNGDRCSSICVLESDVAEVEPNDTTAQVITPVHHMIRGSLTDGDADLYTFTLTAPTTVEFETYDTIDLDNTYEGVSTLTNVDCEQTYTYLNLFDSTGVVTNDDTSLYFDFDDGDQECSYVGPLDSDGNTMQGVLPAGTYTIKVEDPDGLSDDHYILDIKFGGSSGPVPPVAGDLKINEVMLADGTAADTNCDGSFTSTNDEFVEIVNVANHAVDLTGVTVWDAASLLMTTPTPRHMFAPGTTGSMTLDPGKAIVVWGGGAPACPGVTNWFVASSTGGLGLNDTGGETVTLKTGNATSTTLATATWGDATVGKSFNLSPDVTGTAYALHDAITGHAGTFTPGKKNDGTAF